jgi:hypothetical protein
MTENIQPPDDETRRTRIEQMRRQARERLDAHEATKSTLTVPVNYYLKEGMQFIADRHKETLGQTAFRAIAILFDQDMALVFKQTQERATTTEKNAAQDSIDIEVTPYMRALLAVVGEEYRASVNALVRKSFLELIKRDAEENGTIERLQKSNEARLKRFQHRKSPRRPK